MSENAVNAENAVAIEQRRNILKIWKQAFPNAKVLVPVENNVVITHTLNKNCVKIPSVPVYLNGEIWNHPLVANALYGWQKQGTVTGNWYEIILVEVPGTDGSISAVQAFRKALYSNGLDVSSDHYHWKGSPVQAIALHITSYSLTPEQFSCKLIDALTKYGKVARKNCLESVTSHKDKIDKCDCKANKCTDAMITELLTNVFPTTQQIVNTPNMSTFTFNLDNNKLGLASGPMNLNGINWTHPLVLNTLYGYQKKGTTTANWFETMIMDVPGVNGSPSAAEVYVRTLQDEGLSVEGDHYHWKGTDHAMYAIHHASYTKSPKHFLRSTIKAMQAYSNAVRNGTQDTSGDHAKMVGLQEEIVKQKILLQQEKVSATRNEIKQNISKLEEELRHLHHEHELKHVAAKKALDEQVEKVVTGQVATTATTGQPGVAATLQTGIQQIQERIQTGIQQLTTGNGTVNGNGPVRQEVQLTVQQRAQQAQLQMQQARQKAQLEAQEKAHQAQLQVQERQAQARQQALQQAQERQQAQLARQQQVQERQQQAQQAQLARQQQAQQTQLARQQQAQQAQLRVQNRPVTGNGNGTGPVNGNRPVTGNGPVTNTGNGPVTSTGPVNGNGNGPVTNTGNGNGQVPVNGNGQPRTNGQQQGFIQNLLNMLKLDPSQAAQPPPFMTAM